jgi:hypothetical protein
VQCLNQRVFNPSRVELLKGLGLGFRALNPSRVALMALVSCPSSKAAKLKTPGSYAAT